MNLRHFISSLLPLSLAACTGPLGALGGIDIQRDYSARMIALQERPTMEHHTENDRRELTRVVGR